jgi:hypothetical protein
MSCLQKYAKFFTDAGEFIFFRQVSIFACVACVVVQFAGYHFAFSLPLGVPEAFCPDTLAVKLAPSSNLRVGAIFPFLIGIAQ